MAVACGATAGLGRDFKGVKGSVVGEGLRKGSGVVTMIAALHLQVTCYSLVKVIKVRFSDISHRSHWLQVEPRSFSYRSGIWTG